MVPWKLDCNIFISGTHSKSINVKRNPCYNLLDYATDMLLDLSVIYHCARNFHTKCDPQLGRKP